MNVRRYFDASKMRGEMNSVIFINREILPAADDAHICFTIFKDTKEYQWNSKKYFISKDYLWTTAFYFDLFYFWELKSTVVG